MSRLRNCTCVLVTLLWGSGLVLIPSLARGTEPKIVAALQPFVDSHTLAGAVTVVANRDQVLTVDTVGYQDVVKKTPMPAEAIFWIASMSKPITCTALMMLVDEGKIGLNDPVEKYLPEFKNQMVIAEQDQRLTVLKKPGHPVLVRNVMSHTAGLVKTSPLQAEWDSVSLHDASITYGLSPLLFDPDSKYDYNNPGINTAGRIIEVVSGQKFEDFLQQRLFEPLGMKDTTFWPNDEQLTRLAKSYKPNADKTGLEETTVTQLQYPLGDRTKRHSFPGGGLFSSAADLAIFCRMILNEGALDGRRYVSEKSVRLMTTTQTGELLNQGKGEHGYGFGWSTGRKSAGEEGPVLLGKFGHGGAYSTHMNIDADRQLVTIYMVQHTGGYPGTEGNKILPAFTKVAEDLYAVKK